jgi:TrmH family RNA methyltransferase
MPAVSPRASGASNTATAALLERLLTDEQALLDELEALLTSRSHRDRRGWLLAEGLRNLHQVPRDAIVALVCAPRLLPHSSASLLRELSAIPRVDISAERFRQIAQLPHASGLAAIVEHHWTSLFRITPRRRDVWLVVDQIRSAGNLGTLLRTANATSAAGIIMVGHQTDLLDPQVVRASMGSFWALTRARVSPMAFGNWLRRHRIPLIGADPSSSTDFRSFHFPTPVALALGDERKGLSQTLCKLCRVRLRIPMSDQVDSLNVAVAGSLLLYEVYRQR